MNARNLLIGIGIVAVVTGGVLGSGALTQVTAERTATVNVADDSNAAISLEKAASADSTVVSDVGGNTLELEFTNINRNATTTTTAFNVTNTLNSDVGIQIVSSADWLTIDNVNTSNTDWVPLTKSGGTKTVKVTIDTTSGSGYSSSTASADITIIADTENATGS